MAATDIKPADITRPGFEDSSTPKTVGQSLLLLAKKATGVGVDAFTNIFVPGAQGTTAAALVALKGLGQGASAAGEGVKSAATSAASGVKTGFTVGVFLLLMLFGLFAFSQYRAAAGK